MRNSRFVKGVSYIQGIPFFELTPYSFSCGYVQTFKSDGIYSSISKESNGVPVYKVVVWKVGESKPEVSEYVSGLSKARKLFANATRQVLKGVTQ